MIGLPQEIRKISNKQSNFVPKETRKITNPKVKRKRNNKDQ